jgi:hypothetical protein
MASPAHIEMVYGSRPTNRLWTAIVILHAMIILIAINAIAMPVNRYDIALYGPMKYFLLNDYS